MCDVCCAEILLQGKILKVKSVCGLHTYEMIAHGSAAEFKPCIYSLRKNKSKWTKKFTTQDLAGICAQCGFDIKEECRTSQNDEFLDKHFS